MRATASNLRVIAGICLLLVCGVARAQTCAELIPYEPPDRATAVSLRPHLRVGHSVEEQPAGCVKRNGLVWFGLTFYEGEGADGVGGLGAYSPGTKRIEVRRPEWLRDKSVDVLAHDGRFLWLAATQHYEKSDVPHGLARYDWQSGELRRYTGAPCGFSIRELRVDGGRLIVTTNLAVSTLDLAAGRWTHSTNCPRLYRRLLDEDAARGTAYDNEFLPVTMARFDPGFVREYLLEKPVNRWTYREHEAFAMVARDFAEYQRIVPSPSRDTLTTLAERRWTDAAWHDFLLEHGNVEHLRFLRGDEPAFARVLELARRGERDAITVLPWIGGEKAIAPLLALLGDERNLVTTIEALERAAHLRIEADGTRTPLAANSDTPEYADEEFGAFRRYRAPLAELREIARHWAKERR